MASLQKPKGSGHFHAVRFYDDSPSLCRIVAGFVAEGLIVPHPAIIIATADHRAGICEQLAAKSFDVDRLQAAGSLILLDANEILSSIMVDGKPDDLHFKRAIIPVIDTACKGNKDVTVRAYGEMVDVLWKAGQSVAAVRMETLWNHLAQTHDFSLLCGYSMGSFYKSAAQQEEVCRHHTHVVSDSGDAAPVN